MAVLYIRCLHLSPLPSQTYFNQVFAPAETVFVSLLSTRSAGHSPAPRRPSRPPHWSLSIRRLQGPVLCFFLLFSVFTHLVASSSLTALNVNYMRGNPQKTGMTFWRAGPLQDRLCLQGCQLASGRQRLASVDLGGKLSQRICQPHEGD